MEKYKKFAQDLFKQFVGKGYKEANTHSQISRVDNFNRKLSIENL